MAMPKAKAFVDMLEAGIDLPRCIHVSYSTSLVTSRLHQSRPCTKAPSPGLLHALSKPSSSPLQALLKPGHKGVKSGTRVLKTR